MGRKEKWIAKAKGNSKSFNSKSFNINKFHELVDWDESYRTRNWWKKRKRRRYWFGWLEDIMFNIKLRKLSRQRRRKNKK